MKPRFDKSRIRRGVFLTGGNFPGRHVSPDTERADWLEQTRQRTSLPSDLQHFAGAAEAADRFHEIEQRDAEITRRLREIDAKLEAYRKARK